VSSDSRCCEWCGAVPTVDIGLGTHLCARHAKDANAYTCPGCGIRCVNTTGYVGRCSTCEATSVLDALPAAVFTELEALVRERHVIQGIRRLREAQPALGLHDAEHILHILRGRLGVSYRDPVPTLEELIARVASMEARPAAIEAVWDGDTHGWTVDLVAMLPGNDGEYTERRISSVAAEGGDMRLFNGAVPPWPEAVLATALGTAIAAHFGVPFFFGSPQEPDLDQPRWQSSLD